MPPGEKKAEEKKSTIDQLLRENPFKSTGGLERFYPSNLLDPDKYLPEGYPGRSDYMEVPEGGQPEEVAPGVGVPSTPRTVVSAPVPGGIQDWKGKNKKGAQPKTGTYFVGEVSPQLPQPLQDEKAASEAALYNADVQSGYAFLQARRATQRELKAWAELAAGNSGAVAEMVTKRFPEFYKKQQELDAELDAIRTMRVNPYQYLQQAGTGGRAAAVLATAVSQIAVGAGGVNSAMAAIKNSINRDIEAQIQNMNFAYKGLEAKRQNISDQVALMKEEIGFREKTQALAWQAVEAIASANLMGAQNESAYIGLQVLHHKIRLEKLSALEAHLAKMATVIYKEPMFRALDVHRQTQKTALYQDIVNQAINIGAQAGAQQVLQSPAVSTQPGTGQLTAKPSVSSRRPPKTTEAARPMTPEEAARNQVEMTPAELAQEEAEQSAGVGQYTQEYIKEAANIFRSVGGEDFADQLEEFQSYDKTVLASFGDPNAKRIKPLPERAQRWLGGDVIDIAMGMSRKDRPVTIQDAKVLAGVALDTLSPRASKFSREMAEYLVDNPEALTGETEYVISDKGAVVQRRISVIPTTGMGKIKIKEGVVGKSQEELSTDAIQTSDLITNLFEATELVNQIGLARSRATAITKEGWTPVINTLVSGSVGAKIAVLDTKIKDIAVKWIKSRDPSGRLSDQDIAFALGAIAAIREGKMIRLQSWFDRTVGGEVDAATESLQMFWKMMAVDAMNKFIDRNAGYIVLPADKMAEKLQAEKEISAWIDRRQKVYEEANKKNPGTHTFTAMGGE